MLKELLTIYTLFATYRGGGIESMEFVAMSIDSNSSIAEAMTSAGESGDVDGLRLALLRYLSGAMVVNMVKHCSVAEGGSAGSYVLDCRLDELPADMQMFIESFKMGRRGLEVKFISKTACASLLANIAGLTTSTAAGVSGVGDWKGLIEGAMEYAEAKGKESADAMAGDVIDVAVEQAEEQNKNTAPALPNKQHSAGKDTTEAGESGNDDTANSKGKQKDRATGSSLRELKEKANKD